jgi:transcription antitermination factor NusG
MKTLVGYDGDDGDDDEPPRSDRGDESIEPPRPGQAVTIISGPFADFEGIVDNVNQETGKVRIRVSMFGREEPIDLDFPQVKRLD